MSTTGFLVTDGDGAYFTRHRISWDDDKTGTVILVPRGFRTDLASVPRPFWNIVPPTGPHARAAVVHDYLYSTEGLNHRLTRADCDRIFREMMITTGVRHTRAWLMWIAVRTAGWIHFRRRR